MAVSHMPAPFLVYSTMDEDPVVAAGQLEPLGYTPIFNVGPDPALGKPISVPLVSNNFALVKGVGTGDEVL